VHAGSAYIAGHTHSADFPTTPGAFDTTSSATDTTFDAFVAELSPDGDSLVFSTLLGGSGDDWGFGVEVDPAGSVYMTGMTASSDFPTTANALDRTYVGPGAPFYDAFLTKLSGDGSRLLYSAYFGGVGPEIGRAIALDTAGSVYVTGFTFSPDLPVTTAAFSPLFKGLPGYSDAYVAKFSGFSKEAAAPVVTSPIQLSVRPLSARVGQRVRFRFHCTVSSNGRRRPVRGATIRLARRRVHTDRGGRATIVARFSGPGRKRARATKTGLRSATATVRVLRSDRRQS
jgi:hypothetical protein